MDVAGAKLYARDCLEITLTAMEFNLLKLFVHNKGRVLNREQLMEMASVREWDPLIETSIFAFSAYARNWK